MTIMTTAGAADRRRLMSVRFLPLPPVSAFDDTKREFPMVWRRRPESTAKRSIATSLARCDQGEQIPGVQLAGAVMGALIPGTGTSVLSARAMGSASFENVDARNVGAPVPWGDDRELFVNNCGAFNSDWVNGSEFSMTDLGGTTTSVIPPRRHGCRRGSCRTSLPATIVRRSCRHRRPRPGNGRRRANAVMWLSRLRARRAGRQHIWPSTVVMPEAARTSSDLTSVYVGWSI
jgi:hypothetical protein